MDCAVRELREETGLSLDLVAVPRAAYPTFVGRAPATARVELSDSTTRSSGSTARRWCAGPAFMGCGRIGAHEHALAVALGRWPELSDVTSA